MDILCTNGVKSVMLELLPEFERARSTKIAVTWGSTNALLKDIKAGLGGDVAVLTAEAVDELIDQGKAVAGSRVDFAKSGTGVAVRKGAARPDISSAGALRKTLLAAKSIGYSTGPSGVYMQSVFEKLGIAGEVKRKLKQTPSGVFVGTLIASGQTEIGFQQISELVHFAGIDYVGPLPGNLQRMTMFSSAIHSDAKHADGAKALVKFITAPSAAPVIRKHGLEEAK